MDSDIENVIEFYNNDRMALVKASSVQLKRKILELSEKYPEDCRVIEQSVSDSVFAYVPCRWIQIQPCKK